MDTADKKDSITINYKGYPNQIITIEDMPNKLFADIAAICGLEVAISILRNFNGNTIIVPTNGFEKIEKKIILNEYDGYTSTIQRLSRNLGIAEKTVRNVLSKYKIIPADGEQLGLFPQGWQKLVDKENGK